MLTKVLTIDGASGTGKTSVAVILAKEYNYSLLLSGLLYRLVAYHSMSISDISKIRAADIFIEPNVNGLEMYYCGNPCYALLMQPDVAESASVIAKDPLIRDVLLPLQRHFATGLGLVAEGRDMGTIVFPLADAKVFLTASNIVRAERRAKQLHLSGKTIIIDELLKSMERRDRRDTDRNVCPLSCPDDAFVLDTSDLAITEVVQIIKQKFALCLTNK